MKKIARGKEAGDHARCRKVLADGSILITKVSHGSKSISDPDLFRHILRTQLQVSPKQFWDAVDRGAKPVRPGSKPEPKHRDAIPFSLARNLLIKAGVSQRHLAGMTKERAISRWKDYLASRG
ncbi:MAG: hypothetical protein WDA71_04555 [Actinomycetota bacterium]